MAGRMTRTRYTVIGYLVSKLVIPVVRRRMRRKASGAVHGALEVPRRHPAQAGIMAGAALGAVGWLLMRNRPQDPDVIEAEGWERRR